MLRLTFPARRNHRSGLVSAFAMAVALAGGGVVGTAMLGTPAQAQSEKPNYTESFVKVYQPMADIVNAPDGDYAAAKAQIPALLAAIQSPDDRFVAGQLLLSLGNNLKDPAIQRQGLELSVESGVLDPAKLGQFQFFIGNLAYQAQDYAAARAALQAAMAAGYTQDNPEGLIAESYFAEGQAAAGLDYLAGVIEQKTAAGQQVPDAWLMRGLKVAYENKLPEKATQFSGLLVKKNPTQQNWTNALQVVGALNALEPQEELDLLRLMRLTDAMSTRREYTAYIEAADPRSMSNEVLEVLAEGIEAGVFDTGDAYYTEVKGIADSRAAADRADAANVAAEARSSDTGITAQGAGNLFYSLGDYAQAEQMYQLALEKGVRDRHQTLTRLGIAQVRQGKTAEARATFEQVAGSRAPIAQMWLAYIDAQGAASAGA